MDNDLISRSALLENLELLAKYQPAHKQSTILEVCATIRAAPAVDAAPKWISVEERLPEEVSRVLVVLQSGDHRTIHTATYNELGWWLATYKDGTVLYWMPLPEPPKMDGDSP